MPPRGTRGPPNNQKDPDDVEPDRGARHLPPAAVSSTNERDPPTRLKAQPALKPLRHLSVLPKRRLAGHLDRLALALPQLVRDAPKYFGIRLFIRHLRRCHLFLLAVRNHIARSTIDVRGMPDSRGKASRADQPN
jgi:hypothetical protein